MNEGLVVFVRGVISFFTLLIFTRILGKQQIGQITFFDYILGITVGSFAASLTVDLSSAAWPHWVGLLTWTLLGVLMQIVSLKSKETSKYINDEPAIVIHDGKIIGDSLRKTKFTFNELLEQLRLKDVFDINEIKFAIIETNGQLSVFKKEQFKNLIDSMNVPTDNRSLNNELIFNGITVEHNLKRLNLSQEWLNKQLKNNGIDNSIEVFYAYINDSKKLIVNSYKNKIDSSRDIFK